jgi:hypothetical protein
MNKNPEVSRESVEKVWPFLARVDAGTKFYLYREYKPKDDSIEYTLIYDEKDQRWRLDGVIHAEVLEANDVEPGSLGINARNMRLTYFGVIHGYTSQFEKPKTFEDYLKERENG